MIATNTILIGIITTIICAFLVSRGRVESDSKTEPVSDQWTDEHLGI